tara:strand:+ start:510 stop:1391 length:882 start_codon:yes stop_codon:yes gene_type:complete
LSGVISTNSKLAPSSKEVQKNLQSIVIAFGGQIGNDMHDLITHVVATRDGTEKVKSGREKGAYVVHFQWLMDTIQTFHVMDEKKYALKPTEGNFSGIPRDCEEVIRQLYQAYAGEFAHPMYDLQKPKRSHAEIVNPLRSGFQDLLNMLGDSSGEEDSDTSEEDEEEENESAESQDEEDGAPVRNNLMGNSFAVESDDDDETNEQPRSPTRKRKRRSEEGTKGKLSSILSSDVANLLLMQELARAHGEEEYCSPVSDISSSDEMSDREELSDVEGSCVLDRELRSGEIEGEEED